MPPRHPKPRVTLQRPGLPPHGVMPILPPSAPHVKILLRNFLTDSLESDKREVPLARPPNRFLLAHMRAFSPVPALPESWTGDI